MNEKAVQGIYAAVLTPRTADGSVDHAALRSLLRFLLSHGVRRYAINGATGEFCLTTPQQLEQVLATVHEVCGDSAEILCGVGAAGAAQSIDLVRVAEAAGVQGLLLPMPYFFPYRQDDLAAFSTEVATATHVPVLLYNLPQFTSGLAVKMVCGLVDRVPNIIGIKDSSGSLDILQALTERHPDACRIIGNDSALAPALQGGLCDGVVSGVACVLPELVRALYNGVPGSVTFGEQLALLQVFIARLNVFPTPWGLKLAAEARGVLQASFAQPLSDTRRHEANEFLEWCRAWPPMAQPAMEPMA